MSFSINDFILNATKASKINSIELIQELWSGYGELNRVMLSGGEYDSVIVKDINLSSDEDHPRGWNTSASYNRKIASYEVEQIWYEKYANQCDESYKMPRLIASKFVDNRRVFILEDLDQLGYPLRRTDLNVEEVKACLNWLASYHARFLGVPSDDLWETGTYWHFKTRIDEYMSMENSFLKEQAFIIDEKLNSCNYKTLVHGDAKVANFCFSSDMKSVAAVDFQYVGEGCGMKDVAYLFSSCLSSQECEKYEAELLSYYFEKLKDALSPKISEIEYDALEKEWRLMYPIAWADFVRFLLGWMPTHHKLNAYANQKVSETMKILEAA
jgi:hypothetical protein